MKLHGLRPIRIFLHSLRRGTYSEWGNVNPVLANEEIARITDTNELVIGDGKTSFMDLRRIQP